MPYSPVKQDKKITKLVLKKTPMDVSQWNINVQVKKKGLLYTRAFLKRPVFLNESVCWLVSRESCYALPV